MARKATRTLSDAYLKARPRVKGTKPPKVSFIRAGVKYKAGQDPVRVCPVGSTGHVKAEPVEAAKEPVGEADQAPAPMAQPV